MPTAHEIEAATNVVPLARARHIINEVQGEATEDQRKALLELMVWAYGFDREYDWTWSIRDCPLLNIVSSHQMAARVVEDWFGNNQFPIDEKFQDELNVFETWILPALEEWVEYRLELHYSNATWKGFKGLHFVHWNPEKQGHVVVYEGGDFEPVFDYQL